MKMPNHLKPALGGLCTGIIGFFLPCTLAFGYGYAQRALYCDLSIFFLLSLAFGKILTTSFSIGSGGSGGVFGPSVVIGGAAGGAVGMMFHSIMPNVVTQPGAFVIVGMAGFFTAVSNTPISTIIFVSEMTNSYHLLLPSLLVCSVAHLASKRWTIYEKQVQNIMHSPAHAGMFFVDVLQEIHVSDLKDRFKQVKCIPEEMLFVDFKKFFSTTKQHYFPVIDRNNRLKGIFSSTDIRSVLFEPDIENLVVMKDIAHTDIITTCPTDNLNSVMRKLTISNIDSLPVVDEVDKTKLLGMLNRREVISFYNQKVEEMKALQK
jgi:CIC family chloride channel protein